MTPFTVKFKDTPRARKVHKFVRYAESLEKATESALVMVDDETFGKGVLISVEEMA